MIEQKLNIHEDILPSPVNFVAARERQVRMQHNFTPKVPNQSESTKVLKEIKEQEATRMAQSHP
jgi:hypothetical protein